jgi:LmbE family N-acetylglucosaminyl deacetylase
VVQWGSRSYDSSALWHGGKVTRVLAISAHCDDAELGCGGLLQRYDERRIIALSQGERGGDPGQRLSEQEESARILGAPCLVHACDDTAISLVQAVGIIEDEIAAYEPHVVLTMAANDTHQDHRTTHAATLVAVRDYPCTVLAYPGPSSALGFDPNWFVPLNEREMQVKLAALACHRSQSARSYMVPDAVTGMARYWAMVTRCKAQYAEAFECVRYMEAI